MRVLALSALFLCIASVAHAQPGARFERADTNHDGRVTLREYQNFVSSRLMRSKGPQAQKFRSLDPEQQAALLQKRFEKLDKAHKGYLDPVDWQDRHG